VWGDQAYQGKTDVIRQCAPKAVDRINRRWRTKLHAYPEIKEEYRIKSKTRSRVEYIFTLVKLNFGFAKLSYSGLAKNLNRLFRTCALTNLLTARNHLLKVAGQTCA
jgi:IS5 family transposase